MQWWLRLRAYRILATNFRTPRGELDIVALRFNTLHVVEVKTRAVDTPQPPGAALTQRKRLRILRAARAFMTVSRTGYTRVSFDLAEVVLSRRFGAVQMTWDAFRADEVAGATD